MRFLLVLASGALVLAAALPAAAAGPFGRQAQFSPFMQQQDQRFGQRRSADRRVPQRDVQRSPPQRDAAQGSRDRMSPEERQQLRRDIHDAGKDIYRGQGPRRVERRGQ